MMSKKFLIPQMIFKNLIKIKEHISIKNPEKTYIWLLSKYFNLKNKKYSKKYTFFQDF
jgi:hypothetical protein